MQLERLDIRGYRRLRASYELGPGLTLVSGPNEAGKSTLHDALIHALFGFSPEQRRRRREGLSEKDERAPWGGGPFGVTLRAQDPDGRAVLAAWDFATDLALLQDADTGEPLLREKPKQRDDYGVGPRLVGMTRKEFLQVCCLHQEALTTVSPSEELRASLQRSLESAPAEDLGAQGAEERLRKLLASVGVHSGHYRELPGGELQRLHERHHALAQELTNARAGRAELEGFAANLDRARAQREQLAAEVERLTARAAQLQRDSAQAALAREQASLRAHLEELELRISLQEPALEPLTPAVPALEPLTPNVSALEPLITSDVPAIEPLAPDARAVPATLGPAVDSDGDPVVARFRARRDELLALRAHPPRPSWNATLLAAALAVAAISALAAAFVHPALAALLVGAAALAWSAAPRSPQEAAAEGALADFGGRSFDELDRARVEEDRRFATLQAERLAERLAGRLAEQRELQAASARLREHEREHGTFTSGEPCVDPASFELATSPEAAVSLEAAASLAPDLLDLKAQLRATDTQITQLQTVIGEREAYLADPAELEVALAEVRARRARIELERDAIRIARESLRAAAQDTHRRVAPHLNEALRRELPRITRGRYAEGAVDEDLAIKLYAPESGALVSIEQLSRGTRDQVALVQRLEIARLLDPSAGRAPLLLDDPFAHFDTERLRLGAELIAEVAERRQVILFTENPEVAQRIREAAPACAQIELPDPIHRDLQAPDILAYAVS